MSPTPEALDPEQQVIAAAEARARALGERDVNALAELLHPDFGWTTHTGEVLDRATYLASKERSRSRWLEQVLIDPKVVVVGDVATLRALVTDVLEGSEGPIEFRMPMTQVWVKDGSAWRCLAGHAGPRLMTGP